MASEPSHKLASAIDFAREIRDLVAESLRRQNWFILAIILIVSIFIIFAPGIGVIAKALPSEIPALYITVFWTVEVVILLLGVLLSLIRLLLKQTRSLSTTRAATIFVISMALVSLLAVFHYSYQNIRGSIRPTYYLECISSGDCFSWGENTLFSYGYLEKELDLNSEIYVPGNEELTQDHSSIPTEFGWTEPCLKSWRLKTSATSLYYTNKASESLKKFKSNCEIDSESQIYLNNIQVMSKNESSFSVFENRRNINVGIGVALPISSQGGEAVSQEILRGVALAQKEANTDSNPNKVGILIGIADDGFESIEQEADRAIEIAQGFIDNLDIVAAVGHFSSDATEAASRIYEEANFVAISPTSTAVRRGGFQDEDVKHQDTGIQFGRSIFRTAIDDKTVISRLADELIERKQYTRIAVIYEKSSKYSRSFRETFENIFSSIKGAEIVGGDTSEDTCNFSATADYLEEQCLKLAKEQGAQALLLVPSTKSSQGIRQLIILNHQKNNYNFPLIGADSMYDSSFLGKYTEGMMIYIPWHRHLKDINRGSKKFIENADEMFSTPEVNWRTAMAYDATKALIQSIKDTSSNFCRFKKFSAQFAFSERYKSCIRKNLIRTLEDRTFKADGVFGDDTIAFKRRDRISDKIGTFTYVRKTGENKYEFVGN